MISPLCQPSPAILGCQGVCRVRPNMTVSPRNPSQGTRPLKRTSNWSISLEVKIRYITSYLNILSPGSAWNMLP